MTQEIFDKLYTEIFTPDAFDFVSGEGEITYMGYSQRVPPDAEEDEIQFYLFLLVEKSLVQQSQ